MYSIETHKEMLCLTPLRYLLSVLFFHIINIKARFQEKLSVCILFFQQVQQKKGCFFLTFPRKSHDWILLK